MRGDHQIDPADEVISSLTIAPLADRPDLISLIASWHWDEWGHHDPDGSLESWATGLAGRTFRHAIPTTLIAIRKDEPLGSVTLVEHDMSTRTDLSPWLAGLFVHPDHRGQGIGSALLGAAVKLAAELNVPTLYLYTRGAEPFYAAHGWETFGTEFYEGRDVTLMRIALASAF
jgi:GNAT superfamily N-acetyltransferase